MNCSVYIAMGEITISSLEKANREGDGHNVCTFRTWPGDTPRVMYNWQ